MHITYLEIELTAKHGVIIEPAVAVHTPSIFFISPLKIMKNMREILHQIS
jgi:hypothetical protein